jgi:hypothetical protein
LGAGLTQAFSMELAPLPETFAATREALHSVADRLVAPARKPDNEIALMATPGGFGTPPFELGGSVVQIRVEGSDLVLERDGAIERAPLQSLPAAAELLGPELLSGDPPQDSTPLGIDPVAAGRLADFYAFSAEVLERLREGMEADDSASEINLWPEHFDIAFEAGSEADGRRANYGASPGDDQHPEPYLYVGPWTAEPQGELWNATAFKGAELGYAELAGDADPAGAALDFFVERHRALRP